MTYKDRMLSLWREFTEENEGEALSTAEFAQWAIRNGKWHPKPQDVTKRCAADMADALREDLRTDEHGITYHGQICVRTNENGVQLTLWQDTDLAPLSFVQKSVNQRRRSIVDDCYQLKSIVDHLNLSGRFAEQLALPLDFTDDVEELEAAKGQERKRPA